MAVEQGGREPADQSDHDHRDQEHQHVAGQVEVAAQAGQEHGQHRQQRRGQHVPGHLPAQRDRAARPRQAPAPAHLRVGDDVHVDVAGAADGPGADAGAGEHGGQPRPAAGPEHELGRVLGPGEGQQGLGDVVADDLVVGAAHRLDQPPLRGQRGRIGAGQAVGLGDVHGQQVAARGPGGDPGGPADQRLALGPAGQRHDHPLPGLPGALDLVLDAVALQALVHLVGQPEQGELAQRGQVPGAEVVGQRRVDLLRRVDVPVRHPAAQRLGRHVDQLDLVGRADDRVGHGFPLRHAGDLLDHVVEGFQVLDVDRGDHVDPGVEQFLDVLPALLVARPGHVGVRELVHQGDLRAAGEHRVHVHLLERRPAVLQRGPGHDLQAVEQRAGLRAPVRLGEPHHDVGAAFGPAVPLAEHGVGLAHARRGTQVDPQRPRSGRAGASRAPSLSAMFLLRVPRQLELRR